MPANDVCVCRPPRARSIRVAPPVARADDRGVVFVASWVLGLSLFPLGPALDAPASEGARYYAANRASTIMQALVVHGTAAVALAVVLARLRSRRPDHSPRPLRRRGRRRSLPRPVPARRGQERLGWWYPHRVKMLAFALMIGASIDLMRSSGLVGRRMTVTARIAVGSRRLRHRLPHLAPTARLFRRPCPAPASGPGGVVGVAVGRFPR